ncbi:hypothetical protein [Parerythrobacter lacustris]|uniref:Uncharacterized protein n=1 Tax=Parerythrobacter lacustris TaxID=2969984 RepID=A0ABT1XN21_9SPHN|nr:hypothetical protein [Parerythrobacter lacustris]MCR2833043.1 hypothetical protein [Parerythrobacter lacustris]
MTGIARGIYMHREWPMGVEDQAALIDIERDRVEEICQSKLIFDRDDFDDIIYGIVEDFEIPAVLYQRPNSSYSGFCLVFDSQGGGDIKGLTDKFLKLYKIPRDLVSWEP